MEQKRRTHKGGLPISEYVNRWKRDRAANDPAYAERLRLQRIGYRRKAANKRANNLSDVYITGLLAREMGIPVAEIRQVEGIGEIIGTKRELLRLQRLSGGKKPRGWNGKGMP